ncbi:V-type ATP synthase subunit F [Candidatus Micrarchaeota archaeon]|nr:V-type ATP synthase subunit F [Candidatus Micrarchaeota archaeon]
MELDEKIAVIGNSSLVSGFRLAGLRDFFTLEGKQAEDKLSELIGDPTYGIIILEESILEKADWRLKRRIEAIAKPVVVSVPSPSGPMEQSESINMLVKRALGFELADKK